jgi:hypothetical protein
LPAVLRHEALPSIVITALAPAYPGAHRTVAA